MIDIEDKIADIQCKMLNLLLIIQHIQDDLKKIKEQISESNNISVHQ